MELITPYFRAARATLRDKSPIRFLPTGEEHPFAWKIERCSQARKNHCFIRWHHGCSFSGNPKNQLIARQQRHPGNLDV